MGVRIAFAAILLGTGGWVGLGVAGPPPLDRPSPPPCCADGFCYPKPNTWGWYETRWRRWPTEYLPPLPPDMRPPAPLPADVPPYETPSPEEEDRRAPPPTRAPVDEERPELEYEPPERIDIERVPPVAPPTIPVVPPPGVPLEEPFEPFEPFEPSPVLPPEPPPTTLPFGGEPPATPLPFGEPMGQADPPPQLPFVAPRINEHAAVRPSGTALGGPANLSPQRAGGSLAAASHADPPPPLPVSLASWSN